MYLPFKKVERWEPCLSSFEALGKLKRTPNFCLVLGVPCTDGPGWGQGEERQCCHAFTDRVRQLRRRGGNRCRRHGAQALQPVQDHVLLQREMPEASLEGGRAQEALRGARGAARCNGRDDGDLQE